MVGYSRATLYSLLTWQREDVKTKIAEDGFDPSTSGLWAQHASAAPLCWLREEEEGESFCVCEWGLLEIQITERSIFT